jgi:hypothetical protein
MISKITIVLLQSTIQTGSRSGSRSSEHLHASGSILQGSTPQAMLGAEATTYSTSSATKSRSSTETTQVTSESTKVLNKSNHTHGGGKYKNMHKVNIKIRLRFICNKARFYTCNGSFSKEFHKAFL